MRKENILLIDDDDSLRKVIAHHLTLDGYRVISASGGKEGIELFKRGEFDLVITDLKMPDMDGMEVLREIKLLRDDVVVIMITAYGTIEKAVEALKAGAFDYITKPFNRDELKIAIGKALQVKRLEEENLRLKSELDEKFKFDHVIGLSSKMVDVLQVLKRVSKTDSTILLLGESGTGKELIARAIHNNSLRNEKPFVAVNCAAIPEDLLESELFGYQKGSFTGALVDKIGKFEHADGGTIFLDEVGDLKLELQAKLLRVLQEKRIDKIGGTDPIEVNVRVIAATNQNLRELIEKGMFREDLYYRLSVIP
ncbi:MAG: Two component, sigma54 specific, transcriptional regulator, Fis family, partial [Candidatus Gottesmanbacteria bacterium GW2011_GWC2_39_8]